MRAFMSTEDSGYRRACEELTTRPLFTMDVNEAERILAEVEPDVPEPEGTSTADEWDAYLALAETLAAFVADE